MPIFTSLDYVSDIKSTMFQSNVAELNELTDLYKKKEPEPLNRQFENRRSKADAISHHLERKQKVTVLFPPGNTFLGKYVQDHSAISLNKIWQIVF